MSRDAQLERLNTINDYSYDPVRHGALCHDCPLKGRPVSPPEIRRDAILLVIAEAPGKTEVELRRPLVGASGSEYSRAAVRAELSRNETSLSNAILCPPPAYNLKSYLAGLRARNVRRRKQGLSPIPSPLDCCRPRLMREIAKHERLLLFGAAARGAVLGRQAASDKGKHGLMTSRGYPSWEMVEHHEGEVYYRQCLSTVHPAFVLRAKRWTEVFRRDVAKAVRMARGGLEYVPPAIYLQPSADAVVAFLEAHRDRLAYDVETDGKEPTTAGLRCIGLGTDREALCVPWQSVRLDAMPGLAEWYSPAEEIRIRAALEDWFGDSRGIAVDQNGLFDVEVLHNHRIEVRRRRYDTAIGHHVIHSEWPHTLAFQAAQYSDAPAHKDVDHSAWQCDDDLHLYCLLDVAQTYRAAMAQSADERLREQARVFQADMRLSRFCLQLHRIGMHVDVEAKQDHAARLWLRMQTAKARAQRLAVAALPATVRGGAREVAAKMNVGSDAQIRRYLFRACGVDPVPAQAGGLTDAGDASVSRDNLLYLVDRGLTPELEEFVQTVIDYREAQKLRSQYCTSAMMTPLADGRVRPSWNPHVVVSGRLSVSNPNVMNVTGSLREIFDAAPGHLLVACDKAQLERRIIGWLAKEPELIAAFLEGEDVHKLAACTILGISDPDQVTKHQRTFTKTFTYASQYGAGIPKVHQMVRNFRDSDGSRPYKRYALREAEVSYNRWWQRHWRTKQYNEDNIRFWERHGYLEDAIHGRRRYFLDGEDPEAMANFPIQSTAAADVNDAIERVVEAYPWGFAGEATGVVHYNYDSIMLEVPTEIALQVGAHVRELMGSSIGSMPLPCDLGIGPSWGSLEDPDEPKSCKGSWWAKVAGARELGISV